MASTGTGVNVLRWGALAFGIFYGFSHQSAISARDRAAVVKHDYERKQKLIEEAKQKWAEKTQPKKDDGVITNPDDPNFDLEKYLGTIKE